MEKYITKFLQSLLFFCERSFSSFSNAIFFLSYNFVVKFSSFFRVAICLFPQTFPSIFRTISNFFHSHQQSCFCLFFTDRGGTRSGGRCPWSATLSPGPSSAPVFGRGRSSRRRLHGTGLPRRCWPQIDYFSSTHTHDRANPAATGKTVPAAPVKIRIATKSNFSFSSRIENFHNAQKHTHVTQRE